MTRNSAIARSLLAISAMLAAAPLVAEQPVVVTGRQAEPVYQERVSFADLDLRNLTSQQQFRARVHDAAERVCVQAVGRFEPRLSGLSMESTCASRTYRIARPQIVAAIHRATSGQPHPATALIVTAPARAR